jgi:formamidopyrimidine-DNA glycosylase
MPELPEVETVRAGLENYVIGRKITQAISFHPRAIKPSSIAPLSSIVGAKIKSVNRRGKFLWLELDRDFTLAAHLGMSGQLLVQPSNHPAQTHLRAKIVISGRKMSSRTVDEIRFIDQRTFGWLSVEELNNGVPTSASHIAYDPFEPEFDLKQVVAKIRARKTSIKTAILNQEVLSGIGNIYADESLWRARIHPEIICEDLSEDEVKKVISAAASVMKSAIKAGGTSFDEQYKNVNGESGYFSRSLSVYGRQGEPCSRCRAPIARIAFANRSSHFCPRCQR